MKIKKKRKEPKDTLNDKDVQSWAATQYADGGARNPVIGTPQQYQAYQDSLNAYNEGELSYNHFNSTIKKALAEGLPKAKLKITNTRPNTLYNVWEKPKNENNPYDRGELIRRLNFVPIKSGQAEVIDSPPEELSIWDRLNPFKVNNFTSWEGAISYDRFKKPVQPIVYKPTTSTTVGDVVGDKIAKSKDNVAVLNSELIPKNRPKEPTLELNQEQQYLPQKEQQLDFDPIGLKKGTYFTRPRQQQEAGQGKIDYFDNKTGKLLKTMQNGGREPIVGTPQQYQAYQDSLDLYNSSLNLKKVILSPNTTPSGMSAQLISTNANAKPAYQRLKKLNGVFPRPESISQREFDGVVQHVNVYRQPVQPIVLDRPKQQIQELNTQSELIPQSEQQLEFNPIPFDKSKAFSKPISNQNESISKEDMNKKDFFDKKTGKPLGRFTNGGSTGYKWSDDKSTTKPITQPQNNVNISQTTGNRKLTPKEVEANRASMEAYNKNIVQEEYNNRKNRIQESIQAQSQPLSLKNLQTQSQSTGDKLSLAMNSKYGNPKDYPTLSGYIQGLDYINPAKMIGDMTSGLGSVPQDIKQGNYLKAGLSVGTPLFAGATAGIGTQGIKPFVNNLVNPLAGTGEVINNLGNKYLPNAHKLNPFAFKPNSEAYYRGIGRTGLDDALESGYLRASNNKMYGEDVYMSPEFGVAKGNYSRNKSTFEGDAFGLDDSWKEILPKDGKSYIAEIPKNKLTNPEIKGSLVVINKGSLPIDDVRLLKEDWLKGYKQVEVPKTTQNFKSEINWGKWNKEIPENTQLMQEYNAIDYGKNPLSDKEKEMYKWFDEQMRFDKLPQTTNKQSIEVLDNFKQRIRTPEGQKRLKELGITEEQLLQDLKIVEDPNTYGYYRGAKNTIAMNPNHPLPKKVVRHEIEHGVQNALRQSKINKAIDGTVDNKMKALETNTTEIDDILSGLTLRREGTPNKVWSKPNINEPVNINNYKSLINNKQNATDYFLTGSDGAEKSAFLGEVQQYMMDAGKIPKNSYVQITPEMVKETMVDAMFDEKTGGKYLRLFNIIKADPKNYEIISKGLNKMLSITPLIGAGAYMQNKEYKNGGAIGNNGMFDMTNPNIYKAVIPGAIGLGAASQIEKKQNGGSINEIQKYNPPQVNNELVTQRQYVQGELDNKGYFGYGGSVSYKDFKKKYKDV